MNLRPRAIPTMRRTAAATTRRDDVDSSLSIARALWKLAKRGTERGVVHSSSRIVEPWSLFLPSLSLSLYSPLSLFIPIESHTYCSYCCSSILQHTCSSMLQSYCCSNSSCSILHTYCSYCRCVNRCSTLAAVCCRATVAAVCTPTAATIAAVYCTLTAAAICTPTAIV
ncbi:hypothetical protein BHE74_00042708 [Ensete ventricosum]|nr:hypothetical protein BHE74_00042708 [Ensete ventricosum]